jgi:3-oxoacyl-[acyl-carrier protein] reductase
VSRAPIRTAIVTGTSRGIGAAIARQLAGAGITVIVNYAGNADAAGETIATIAAAGGTAHAIRADVSDSAAFGRLPARC